MLLATASVSLEVPWDCAEFSRFVSEIDSLQVPSPITLDSTEVI